MEDDFYHDIPEKPVLVDHHNLNADQQYIDKEKDETD